MTNKYHEIILYKSCKSVLFIMNVIINPFTEIISERVFSQFPIPLSWKSNIAEFVFNSQSYYHDVCSKIKKLKGSEK